MNFNHRGSTRKSRVSYFVDSSKQVESDKRTDSINNNREDSLRYIQELKKALNVPINKSEQNVMQSLKLLKDMNKIENNISQKNSSAFRHSKEKNLLTFETRSTCNYGNSQKDSKNVSPDLDKTKVILNGQAIRDRNILFQITQDNKPSDPDDLPIYPDMLDQQNVFQTSERPAATKLKNHNVLNNTIGISNFNDVEPLYVNIRGQLEPYIEDAQSSFPSIDERSLYLSYGNQNISFTKDQNNPFIESGFKKCDVISPGTKVRNNQVNFLLDRKYSGSESYATTSKKTENIQEALRLGIALSRDKSNTHENSFYRSNSHNVNCHNNSNNPNSMFYKLKLDNNVSDHSDRLLENQQSFRYIDKNNNYYRFKNELDNYQSNASSAYDPPQWTDIKSLNLFSVNKQKDGLYTQLQFQPNLDKIDDHIESKEYDIPTRYAEENTEFLKHKPALGNQNTLSSMLWDQGNNILSEKDIFEAKQLICDEAEVTFQSLGSQYNEARETSNHPFINSHKAITNDDTTNMKKSSKENKLASFKKTSNGKDQVQIEYPPSKSQKIEDFMYEEDSWDSYVSNRLNQIIDQADAQVKDFIETDQIFKKNTGYDYTEYHEPANLDFIEVDNNDPTFISSNRLSEKCSIDAHTYNYRTNRKDLRNVISDNTTPNKPDNMETQYFSFNPSDKS